MSEEKSKPRILKYAINLVFVGFFVFWLTQIDASKLGGILGNLQAKYILYFIASYVLSYALYAKKYQLLFSRIKEVRYLDLFFLTCAGSYSNFVVPASGELLKAFLLKKREGIDFAGSAVIIVLEKILSIVVLLFLLCFIILFVDLQVTLKSIVL